MEIGNLDRRAFLSTVVSGGTLALFARQAGVLASVNKMLEFETGADVKDVVDSIKEYIVHLKVLAKSMAEFDDKSNVTEEDFTKIVKLYNILYDYGMNIITRLHTIFDNMEVSNLTGVGDSDLKSKIMSKEQLIKKSLIFSVNLVIKRLEVAIGKAVPQDVQGIHRIMNELYVKRNELHTYKL